MKIVYIANIRIPTHKAHGTQIAKMCEAFVNLGLDLELVIPRRLNTIKEDIFSYYFLKNRFKVSKLFTIDTLGILKNKFAFVLQSISFSYSVLFYLRKINYKGLVYSRDYLVLYLLSFSKKYKLYFEIHTWPNKINFLYKRLFKRVYFIAISQGLKNELLKCGVGEDRILLAADGVDLKMFEQVSDDKAILRQELTLPTDKKIIAFIGKLTTMGQSKGTDDLFLAFAKILSDFPEVFLLVVGLDDSELDSNEKSLVNLSIKPGSYKLVKHVSQDMVIKYEKAADILIMAYPDKKHYRRYMSPLKMFEYMAARVPIISTDLPAVRDVLNDNNSILVKAGQSQALAEGIERILKNPAWSVALAQQARKDVELYSWDNRAKKIISFIRE